MSTDARVLAAAVAKAMHSLSEAMAVALDLEQLDSYWELRQTFLRLCGLNCDLTEESLRVEEERRAQLRFDGDTLYGQKGDTAGANAQDLPF
jgi:hypothetical protein